MNCNALIELIMEILDRGYEPSPVEAELEKVLTRLQRLCGPPFELLPRRRQNYILLMLLLGVEDYEYKLYN